MGKKSVKTVISDILELPEYTLGGMRLEITSNKEAVVENCKGILEYTQERIRLLTPGITIKFTGKELYIGCMSGKGAVVSGVIDTIEFSALG